MSEFKMTALEKWTEFLSNTFPKKVDNKSLCLWNDEVTEMIRLLQTQQESSDIRLRFRVRDKQKEKVLRRVRDDLMSQ